MSDAHILKSFDEALNALSSHIAGMGDDVAAMVASSGAAFLKHDIESAKEIVRKDREIDRQHDECNAIVVDILARLHPIATDLREVLAMEHIAANLERIADHAKGIAKRCIASEQPTLSRGTSALLAELNQAVLDALRKAIEAIKTRNPAVSEQITRNDDRLDQLYDDLFHAVIAELQTASGGVVGEVQALFVGKSLERIGDHATNIAEQVRFMAKGILPTATRGQ